MLINLAGIEPKRVPISNIANSFPAAARVIAKPRHRKISRTHILWGFYRLGLAWNVKGEENLGIQGVSRRVSAVDI